MKCYALIILTETDRHAIVRTMCSLTFLRFEKNEGEAKEKIKKITEIYTRKTKRAKAKEKNGNLFLAGSKKNHSMNIEQ